jgi:hypothetical protein
VISVKTGTTYTQAYGVFFCLHIAGLAIFFGRKKGYGARLEFLTDRHWLKFSRGR